MTMILPTVSIGPGRRVTLQELYNLATGAANLQWQDTGDCCEEVDEATTPSVSELLSAALAQLKVDESESSLLTQEQTRAFLVVLAFQVVPTEHKPYPITQALVQMFSNNSNSNELCAFPRDAKKASQVLQQVLPAASWTKKNETAIVVERSLELAVLGLAVYAATQLSVAALPIAAVTCDASGHAASILLQKEQHCYSEVAFDTWRPHRAMITAAATLRAVLNDTRYKADQEDDQNGGAMMAALRDIPQYHGPATEDIQQAAKRLELELNSHRGGSCDKQLDATVSDLTRNQVAAAVTVQTTKSLERQGITVLVSKKDQAANEKASSSLLVPDLVQQWQAALSQEAASAVTRIQDATAAAAEQARRKEAQKAAARAAQQSQESSSQNDDKEFEGKTEAQKAKILRIRAEKEKKAAAKRQAKEKKGVTLFGAGTPAICQILQQHLTTSNNNSNDDSNSILLWTIQEKNEDMTLAQQLTAVTDKLLSGGVQRKPKIPKGTRDYLPEQMMIRQQAFSIIRRVFQSHGAVEIDTPVFELKDTLTGKYGEDSKLIYDLADQGGELLALRYDLTVPFARFLALNSVGNIKRFHIGKVYRRDQPALSRGRYREFYQCDFDIAGTYGRMVPDSECVCVVCDILDALPIGDFGIKLNHRCLLDAILDICGVPADKFRTICSAVDKLDKEPWSEVKREMVEDKGLEDSVADKIGEFVLNKGAPLELYKELMESKRFGNHKGAAEAMEDLRILFEYLEAFDKLKFVSFDLSLARGLDYYTGVIYEAVCMSGNTQVGSIGGGGRYDNLVSMFQEAGKQTPCVGVSVGIERVFTLMEAKLREEQGGSIKQPNVNVLVASAGGSMMKEKMKIARMLWDANISAEFSQKEVNLNKDLRNADERDIPFAVIVGEAELSENKCNVKNLKERTEVKVAIPELVASLRQMGVIPVGCELAAELLQNEGSA